MKLSLLLISVIISGSLFAQTKRQTNESPNTKEVYYVLKSDKSIKEGPYAQYSHFGDKLICEGFYKNNLKDSLWKYYSFWNAMIYETGYYKQDKKIGIWDVYNLKGEQEIKYDYTNGRLLFYKANPEKDTLKISVVYGRDTIKAILDQRPLYLDGVGGMSKLLSSNIRYPAKARERNVQGKVWIAFTVDTLGKTSNFRVKKGIGSGCDEEALRVVKLIEGDWLPGILKGKSVTTEYELPINFALQSD